MQAMLKTSTCLVRLQKEDSVLRDCVAKMPCHDVNSLEELEEIKRLEAEAAEQAKNIPPGHVPYDVLADVDSLFDQQTLAYLGDPQVFQGSGSGISPAPSGS